VSERITSPVRGDDALTRIWSYDKRGRIVRRVERRGLGSAARETTVSYRYDRKGLLAEERESGREPIRYESTGGCDSVAIAREAPRPEAILGSHACVVSPLGFLSNCFEPRAVAIPRAAEERVPPPLAAAAPVFRGEASDEFARWVPFELPELGLSVRFPEAPLAANRGFRLFGWSRSAPFLSLGVEVFPAPSRESGVEGALAGVVASEEEDECGEIEHFPLWLASRSEIVQRGRPAIRLEGEYAAGLVAPGRVTKSARLVAVGDHVYFAYAMYPSGDEEGRRAAEHFLSTFEVRDAGGR
jgi:hypothetical protein